jgi:ABC-type phosphate/phosphonate transport system substrate-binding protein
VRLISYLTPGFPVTLFEAMAEVLDAELITAGGMSGPGPDDDPLSDGPADLAWVCSTSFVELAARPASDVRLAGVAWVPADPGSGGRPVYFADVVVRPDSPARDLTDLAGRRIGCNDPMSLSGYHALRFELLDRDHDPDEFAELVMSGAHRCSIERLLAGELDAAVIDSVLLASWARTEPEIAALRVVRRLGPWPTQPLVAAGRLGPDVIAEVRRRLLAANADAMMRDEFERAGLSGLVEVASDHCATVELAMRSR